MLSCLLDGPDGGALSQLGIALLGGFLGSIVGAIIGGKYAVGAVRTADTLTTSHERKKLADELRARRVALNVELEYILESVAEIRTVVKIPMPCAKHLNWDFLEACRLDWYKADSDEVFIKALAKAYRDVVLTNDQLDNTMDWAREIRQQDRLSSMPFKLAAETVLAALDSAQGSVGELKKLTEEKLASSPATEN